MRFLALVSCLAWGLFGCSGSSGEPSHGAGRGGTSAGGSGAGAPGGAGSGGAAAGQSGAEGGTSGSAGAGMTVVGQAKESCEKLLAAGCMVGTEEQCEKSINDIFAAATAAGCVTEFNVVLDCRNTGSVSCDAQGTLQSPRCLEETKALNTCLAT